MSVIQEEGEAFITDTGNLIPNTESFVHSSARPCAYLKTKGCLLIHKILNMAKSCSPMSKKLALGMKEELDRCLPDLDRSPSSMFDCSSCEGYTTHPVCLPCGHSLCQLCLEKIQDKEIIKCSICRREYPLVPIGFNGPRRPTLILQNIFDKHCPLLIECRKWRAEGNKFAKNNDFSSAITFYNKALETGVEDHRVYSNRSRAFLAVGDVNSALMDAEKSCSLKPLWTKSHYRRGVALNKLGSHDEAVAAFLLSFHLAGSDQSIFKLLCQELDNLLSTMKSNLINEQNLILTVVSICVKKLSHYHKDMKTNTINNYLPKLDETDLECVLCTCILFNPVTVPCGHSFCQTCLARLFDHSPYCPVCRSSLGEMFAQHTQSSKQMSIDQTLQCIILSQFGELYQEKKKLLDDEMLRSARIGQCESEEIPIFICTVGFPGMPCPLHIFEPRYRLMMRRSIENNSRRFGICAPMGESGNNFTGYGTVLFISSLEYTPDGRSLVTTVGERRFMVLERGTRDGYAVARIRFINDDPISDEEKVLLDALQEEVYRHCCQWLQSLPLFTRLKVMQNVCSPLPSLDLTQFSASDGPTWVWWFINALPTSNDNKLQFLSSTSLKQRLLMLKEMLPLPFN